ncbi:MAG: hypothetical protein CVU50_02320 [Candidatus Cloacimonetes bacterium HGW-Cloacimonetes-3]|nr:MAG: hypothetical protein CVU50_02320 [Candidatus Cloacimonetes bacterium HGW-Cloacimonetes-3]
MKKYLLFMVMLCLALTSAFALNQIVSPDSPDYDAYKRNQVYTPEVVIPPTQPSLEFTTVRSQSRDGSLLFPLDGSYTLAFDANDDGYTAELPLPFTFNLFGFNYNSFWINNNGNVTFDTGYSSYTPWGFPIAGAPMLAPFFADVDTRGTGSVWYKIEANRVIVTWDHVGYYNSAVDRLNTFQVIFTDGTDPLIGLGNNVAFSYGDLAWTTGSASGGIGGLGWTADWPVEVAYGTPATVGINAGDGVLYAQTGRFDREGYDYDGAYGNNDGIDWLDWVIFYYNATGAVATLTITPQDLNVVVSGPGLPAGLLETTPNLSAYFATYPEDGTQTVNLPVGAGIWRGWIYYSLAWHQADVFPVTGPGTIVFSNVPFTGAKSDIPIIVQGEDEVLPVELTTFSAAMTSENYVSIQWTTQTETNLSGFYLYRNETSEISNAIQISGLIDPTNTSQTQHYLYTDNSLDQEGVYYYWLQVAEMDGSEAFHGPTAVNFTTTTEQTDVPAVSPATGIRSIYPNPITPASVISYVINKGAEVRFVVYNSRGQIVNSFNEGFKTDGKWNTSWDGKDANGKSCSTGIYYIKMIAGYESSIRKAVVLK